MNRGSVGRSDGTSWQTGMACATLAATFSGGKYVVSWAREEYDVLPEVQTANANHVPSQSGLRVKGECDLWPPASRSGFSSLPHWQLPLYSQMPRCSPPLVKAYPA